MLGKTKPKPMIGILTGSLSPTSNRSATVSPRSPKPFDLGAVGLGIVAALDTSGDTPANRALFTRSLSRSSPIPVKNCSRNSEEMVTESFEEYRTIVTCHGPNESYTKVYGDGRKGDDRNPFRIHKTVSSSSSSRRPSVFHISPPKIGDYGGVPPPDFLSSCNLCHKKLHDKDIYMYRGEKAFCSTECRYRQMVVDERAEKSEKATPIRAVEVASSPYSTNGGQMFTTGILAI